MSTAPLQPLSDEERRIWRAEVDRYRDSWITVPSDAARRLLDECDAIRAAQERVFVWIRESGCECKDDNGDNLYDVPAGKHAAYCPGHVEWLLRGKP